MSILTAILNTLMVVICLFLICLILIQRGKGGGLAGAFGGVGGSSAFGTKAGDIFTRVTVIVASVWIVISLLLVVLYNQGGSSAWGDDEGSNLARELAKPKSIAPGSVPPIPGPSPVVPTPGNAPSPAPAGPTSVPAIPDAK